MAEVPGYGTAKEKRKVFSICDFADTRKQVDLVLDRLDDAEMGKYFFRGTKKASYKLYTSGQRFWIQNDLAAKSAASANHATRREGHYQMVRRLLHLMRSEVGVDAVSDLERLGVDRRDDLGLLSYMQHWKCPTPMLDLTEDPFVALYFASEEVVQPLGASDLDNYCSLYFLPRALVDVFNRGYRNAHNSWLAKNPGESIVMANFAMFFQAYILALHQPWLIDTFGANVGCILNNVRVTNQCGLFLYNGTADFPLVEAVREFERNSATVTPGRSLVSEQFWCLNIHRKHAAYVRERLKKRSKSITHEYLFPCDDLDIGSSLRNVFLSKPI